ncbi:MAG: hypothetical protein KGL93_12420 [Gemmatimonadota bacterium]|nr:hypothetical protein [Gemmatimonadota bacterium]HEU4989147.1 hypothetical protein [Gemmatimonadaceae bacterium]
MSAGDTARQGRATRTLRAVVREPGTVTRAVLDGRGTEYLSLGRLLTVCVAVFFALTWVQQRRPAVPSPDVAAACDGSGSDTSALGALLGAAGGNVQGASPAASAALGIAHQLLCDPARFTRAFTLAAPVAFLLLIPLSAWLMQLAFRRQMPTFAANWTYGLEAHAALFLLLAVLAAIGLLGSSLLGFLASIAGLVYASWNVVAGVQRAYGVSRGVAARRTTAVGVVYALALTAVTSLVMWGLLSRG